MTTEATQRPLTAEELVARLELRDDREIRAPENHRDAARAGLVFAWYVDDAEECVEFRGALTDCVPFFEGGYALLTAADGIIDACEHDDGDGCTYYQRAAEGAVKLWLRKPTAETPYPWLQLDGVPFLTFRACEGGAVTSRGIVFRRAQLRGE